MLRNDCWIRHLTGFDLKFTLWFYAQSKFDFMFNQSRIRSTSCVLLILEAFPISCCWPCRIHVWSLHTLCLSAVSMAILSLANALPRLPACRLISNDWVNIRLDITRETPAPNATQITDGWKGGAYISNGFCLYEHFGLFTHTSIFSVSAHISALSHTSVYVQKPLHHHPTPSSPVSRSKVTHTLRVKCFHLL